MSATFTEQATGSTRRQLLGPGRTMTLREDEGEEKGRERLSGKEEGKEREKTMVREQTERRPSNREEERREEKEKERTISVAERKEEKKEEEKERERRISKEPTRREKEPEEVGKAGYLEKVSPNQSFGLKLQRRFFAFVVGELRYWRTEEDMQDGDKPLGVLALQNFECSLLSTEAAEKQTGKQAVSSSFLRSSPPPLLILSSFPSLSSSPPHFLSSPLLFSSPFTLL